MWGGVVHVYLCVCVYIYIYIYMCIYIYNSLMHTKICIYIYGHPAYLFMYTWVSEWKLLSHVWLSATPWIYSLWNSPGQNTGMGSLSLLQGIFPTQGSNPGLPHCRRILYCLSHQGNPRILEWVAYPFSRRSSWSRHRTGVSCIAGRFFTSWVTREAPVHR